MCSIGKKPFTVGLVAQLFQPTSNRVETVEKALVATAFVFTQALIAATCVIDCVISSIPARATLLANKKDEKHV